LTSKRSPAVNAYLAKLPADKRAALQRLRKMIHTVLPRAEETISYGIPAVRVDGRVLVWFSASSKHCSFFPGGAVQDFRDELTDYSISKGTVRFTPDQTLPLALVRKLIKARLARVKR
jgi:uncharacterized protein YdhG (YjbR/CyaY superfamily)